MHKPTTLFLIALVIFSTIAIFEIPTANAAITRSHGWYTTSGNNVNQISGTMNYTASYGNTIICCVAEYGLSSANSYVTSITQDGVYWQKAISQFNSANWVGCEIWYGYCNGTVSPSFTISFNNNQNWMVEFGEYTGIAKDGLDVKTTNYGTSATPNTGTTSTTNQADELIIGVIYGGTPTGGYTAGYTYPVGAIPLFWGKNCFYDTNWILPIYSGKRHLVCSLYRHV